MRELLERFQLRNIENSVIGDLKLDPRIFKAFREAPYDMLPGFQAPPGREGKPSNGRGKDHPRYGRFIYAVARALEPEAIVEVGTYAGGTSIGWCRALIDNGRGTLTCNDNDSYSKGTYPDIAERNLLATGIDRSRVELLNGDARKIIPELSAQRAGSVDIFLVDADHTFEGAYADITNGLGMLKPGGLVLVHDLDRSRTMAEQTDEHPHPVYEAFMQVTTEKKLPWCIFPFVRKHLGAFRVES